MEEDENSIGYGGVGAGRRKTTLFCGLELCS